MIENTESEKIKFNGLSLILKLFQLSEISYVHMPICFTPLLSSCLEMELSLSLVENKNYWYQL